VSVAAPRWRADLQEELDRFIDEQIYSVMVEEETKFAYARAPRARG